MHCDNSDIAARNYMNGNFVLILVFVGTLRTVLTNKNTFNRYTLIISLNQIFEILQQ